MSAILSTPSSAASATQSATQPAMQPDLARMKRDLAALVGINTENPPGREIEAAQLVHRLLEEAGFDLSLSEYKPGRANVMARLENGPGPT